ncbi:MAG: carbohydrate ABC transporter permease [Armatimonadetes bacterium]|nr:carbohydrate ABC transporter permease [Armatimonadota bacterium]
MSERAVKVLVSVLLAVGSALFLMPFLVSVFMAAKTPAELSTTPPFAPPAAPTLDNFRTVLVNPNLSFFTLFRNTLFIATVATVGTVFSASLVAYAFARLRFVGRDRLFMVLLSTMMLPGVVTMIPTYVMLKELRWVDTFLPLTVPAFLGGGAFNVFLLRQYLLGVPKELDEAAKMDGAGHWTIYSRVLMPLCGPALATVGIFTFIGAWRDFMGPLIYLNDPQKQTLELGLNTYNSMQTTSPWHLIMAGSVLVTVPLVLIFFVGQRYFVKGIAMTGLK